MPITILIIRFAGKINIMKFKIILFSMFSLFIILYFCNNCFADYRESSNESNLLSSNEIDLLVGTPEGIAEPLDSRRNTITKDNQVDYSKFLDENALSDTPENKLEWKDAEESVPNENQVENQLMDLLAETEELEKTDEIYYYDEETETATDSKKI
jgi:hypothetical protein